MPGSPTRFVLFAAFVLLLIPSSAVSQSNEFLSRLEGNWQGDGKAVKQKDGTWREFGRVTLKRA